jgi:hypothetical protein
MIVSLRPDLDALSDQDAPDAAGRAAAQNAEIIQAGAVEIALGQFLGRDRDRDRPPWRPFNHLPVPIASPPPARVCWGGKWVLVDLCDHEAGGRKARDVATMFDKLKVLADKHAALHADRARLAAEREQAWRPWWKRLMGLKR